MEQVQNLGQIATKAPRNWGNERDNQIEASFEGYRLRMVPRKAGLFNQRVKMVEESHYVEESTAKGDTFSDDDPKVFRCFRHTCGLIRAVLMPGNATYARNGGSHFALLLDGGKNEVINLVRTAIVFRPEDPRLVDGPIVVVGISGTGTRRGLLEERFCYSAELIFKDEQQMKRFIRLPLGRMKKPGRIGHNGTVYILSDDGLYRTDDGTLLPMIIMWWFLTVSEQAAYCKANPDFVVPEEPPVSVEEALAEASERAEAEMAEAGGDDGVGGDGGTDGDGVSGGSE